MNFCPKSFGKVLEYFFQGKTGWYIHSAEFIREEFRCLVNCPICGKCSFLRGREAEDLYADYIEGYRSFRDITAEHRNNNIK